MPATHISLENERTTASPFHHRSPRQGVEVTSPTHQCAAWKAVDRQLVEVGSPDTQKKKKPHHYCCSQHRHVPSRHGLGRERHHALHRRQTAVSADWSARSGWWWAPGFFFLCTRMTGPKKIISTACCLSSQLSVQQSAGGCVRGALLQGAREARHPPRHASKSGSGCVGFFLSLETLASWQHCIDHNTTVLGCPKLVRNLHPGAWRTYSSLCKQGTRALLKRSHFSTSFRQSSGQLCTSWHK